MLQRLPKLTMPDALLDTLELLAGCLSATPAAIVHWHKMYTSNLPASGQLLHFIGEENWMKTDGQDGIGACQPRLCLARDIFFHSPFLYFFIFLLIFHPPGGCRSWYR